MSFTRAGLIAILAGAGTIGLALPTALAGGDKELGAYLSSECVTCHQVTGQYEGIPSIVGWPEASFIEIMNEYRQKQRDNPVMQTIAGRLSAAEIAALAAYFGGLKYQAKGQ
jgi:cytochrome c